MNNNEYKDLKDFAKVDANHALENEEHENKYQITAEFAVSDIDATHMIESSKHLNQTII